MNGRPRPKPVDAVIYGALLELTAKARSDDAGDTLALWKRRGRRAFDAEGAGEPTA